MSRFQFLKVDEKFKNASPLDLMCIYIPKYLYFGRDFESGCRKPQNKVKKRGRRL